MRGKRRAKKGRLIRRLLYTGVIVGLLVVLVWHLSGRLEDKWDAEAVPASNQLALQYEGKNLEYAQALLEKYPNDKRVANLLENLQEYPEPLIGLAIHNEEALDFVLGYSPEKTTLPPSGMPSVTKGELPHLLQWDDGWGYLDYGGQMLAINGCGPTCLSMVAAGLTGDASLTPKYIADFSVKRGYYVSGTGTSWQLMSEGARELGLRAIQLGSDEDAILRQLRAGHPVIVSVSPGDFTTEGHYIVLSEDAGGGRVQVLDPNSRQRSRAWDLSQILSQAQNLWAFQEA